MPRGLATVERGKRRPVPASVSESSEADPQSSGGSPYLHVIKPEDCGRSNGLCAQLSNNTCDHVEGRRGLNMLNTERVEHRTC